MALLVGRHVNKIDKKGRVSVPKPLRDSLARRQALGDYNGLFAFPSFKYPAIELCGEQYMQRLADGLEDLDVFSDDQDDLAAIILENAHQLPFDSEGRIVLPQELIAFANVDGEVLFVGRGARMFVWEPAAYDANRGQAIERARARGATLSLPKRGPMPGEGGGA